MTVAASTSLPFNVLYVGAGEINFGSPEGPWNHSKRLEAMFGSRLVVVGILDPATQRAQDRINDKQQARVPGYQSTQVFSSPQQAGQALSAGSEVDLIVVGAPPHFRGSTTKGADLDVQLLDALPKARKWLVEKPVAAERPSDKLRLVASRYQEEGRVVGAGYMMCALKGVEMIQKIIGEKNLTVMGTAARYYMAYEYARKPAWWNKNISCGPIVEQATHLASLSLLFGGAPRLASVRTHTVEHSDKPGALSKLGFDEEGTVEAASRIPRYTSAVWKYEQGAVGSLTHVVGLHGATYDTEFEVICDGTTFKLVDMYTSTPRLFIRNSGESSEVQLHSFPDDDPFLTQLEALCIDSAPKCSYEDALKTYELTWAIREAGEREREENA